jgi:hypothetical protein
MSPVWRVKLAVVMSATLARAGASLAGGEPGREVKMARRTSQGECSLCGGTFGKAAMTRHLASCRQRAAAHPAGKRRPRRAQLLHLVAEGDYLPQYWLHLEVPARATLEELDDFLRKIWLECCGHLSAFNIRGETYISHPIEEYDRGLEVAIGEVLSPGDKLSYEYDFGTTTELKLKVVSEREGEIEGGRIRLLARNHPPAIKCQSCGEPATQVCSQCIWDSQGWLCDECIDEHECGEEMLLPVVNSPRVGMCGYTG